MNTPETQENHGDAPNTSPNGNQPQSWPMMILMYVIVGPVVLFWEGTKKLFTSTYTDAESHDINVLNLIIGVIVSLVAGIGIGYQMGWASDPASPLLNWLSTAVGTSVAVFAYGWTLLYNIGFRHAFRLSERLWTHVNLDGKTPYQRYGETPRRVNPSWFTQVLLVVGWIAAACVVADTFWVVTHYVQAHQAGWGWLGAIVGIAAIVIAAIVAIAVLGFVASEMSGFLCFLLVVAGAAFCYFKWAFVSGMAMGLYNNLTGSDWGNWGYVVGGLVGVIAGAITAGIIGTLLHNLKLRLVAVAASAGATYALAPWTAQYVGQFDLGAFSIAAPALPWIAYALEFFVIVGYVFPLAHIVITHALKRLADIPELMESVYDEARGGYREFSLSILTIAATVAVGWYGPALSVTYGGFTSLWLIYGITAAAVLATYTLGGKLLLRTGIFPLGLLSSIGAGLWAYAEYIGHGLWFGWVGGAAAGVAAGVVTLAVVFPLAYHLLRFLTQGWLGAWLRDPLVNLHNRVSKGIVDLVDELFQAARNTYEDRTPFRETALQIANLAASGALTYGAWVGSLHFGFALWLSIATTAATLIAAYVLVGQLFMKQGVGLVGLLVAIVGGVFSGVMVHGAQPYGYWLSVPLGLVGAALTASAFFPWAYLLSRAILNIISQETWLRPALVGTHTALWNRFATLRHDFMVIYRQVRDGLARMKDNFYRQYEQIRSQMFGGKK